jgi:hypothetical protein
MTVVDESEVGRMALFQLQLTIRRLMVIARSAQSVEMQAELDAVVRVLSAEASRAQKLLLAAANVDGKRAA